MAHRLGAGEDGVYFRLLLLHGQCAAVVYVEALGEPATGAVFPEYKEKARVAEEVQRLLEVGVVVVVGPAAPEVLRVKDEDDIEGAPHPGDEVVGCIDLGSAEEVEGEFLAQPAVGGKDGDVEGTAGAQMVEPAHIIDETVKKLVVADGAGEVVDHAHVPVALAVVLKCGEEPPLKLVERILAVLLKTKEVVGKGV